MIKAAILQCDDVLDKFQPKFGNYPQMIQQLFASQTIDLEFDIFDCRLDEYPRDINQYDFYITTGSRHSVNDALPWIDHMIEFIKLLDDHNKKLIGICFGHQVMALALGQVVESSSKGWGVGLAQNRILQQMPWMDEYRPTLDILVSHQDQVLSIPKGAIVIAESDFCPYFMVQWNDHMLSIQGHPEWVNEYSSALINNRRDIIPPERVNAGLFSLRLKPDNEVFARWMCNFITT